MEIIDELQAITSRFDQEGVDHALCGGLAMAICAMPRATLDTDLLIHVDALRRLCLSLARSSVAREIAVKHPTNRKVRRTAQALGR